MAFFNHYLVPNTSSCTIRVNAMCLSKRCDSLVLGQIPFAPVLYIMVERKHELIWRMNIRDTQGFELFNNRRGIVMRHTFVRTDLNKLPRPGPPFDNAPLCNFLHQRQRSSQTCHDDAPSNTKTTKSEQNTTSESFHQPCKGIVPPCLRSSVLSSPLNTFLHAHKRELHDEVVELQSQTSR